MTTTNSTPSSPETPETPLDRVRKFIIAADRLADLPDEHGRPTDGTVTTHDGVPLYLNDLHCLVDLTPRQEVLQRIADERERQISLGWTLEHDDRLGLNHLITEAHYRLGHPGEFSSADSVRHELLKATTILVAALEFADRYIDHSTPEERIDPAENPLLPATKPPRQDHVDESNECTVCGENADYGDHRHPESSMIVTERPGNPTLGKYEIAEMCLLCHDMGPVNFKCACGRQDAHHPVANSKQDANGEPYTMEEDTE